MVLEKTLESLLNCKEIQPVHPKGNQSWVFIGMEKAMATHSSTLAWKIPWTEEPGKLQSVGSRRVGHDWETSLSHIGNGNGNPLQCSCLENPRDGGAWWAAVFGVTQSQTQLKRLSSSSSSSIDISGASQVALVVRNPSASARDMSSIPGSGRSPREGSGNPLQYSCLVNPMDRGAWWAIVHEVAKSWTRLSIWTRIPLCTCNKNNAAAAAAKSLQLCLTLCDPIDRSPWGSPIPGILQARNTGVGCHFLLQCMKAKSEKWKWSRSVVFNS